MKSKLNPKAEPYEDNSIEFSKGSKVATLSISRKGMVTQIKKLSEKYPKECKIVAINSDGSICAHVPTTWVHIEPDEETVKESPKRAEKNKPKKKRRVDAGKEQRNRSKRIVNNCRP